MKLTFGILIFIFGFDMTSESADEKIAGELILIPGGYFKSSKSRFTGRSLNVPSFYISKFEVTQKEWLDVMGTNPSEFKGENLPVEKVTWYEAIIYCNKLSERDKFAPCYTIDKTTKDPLNKNLDDDLKWTVTIDNSANGYRLPTTMEWEYAASGGQSSGNHLYSGGDDLEKLGWYWQNCGKERLSGFWNFSAIQANGCKTKPVGSKNPNELGLYDMSGNVREWCWEWYIPKDADGIELQFPDPLSMRTWRGGGWMGTDSSCTIATELGYQPMARGNDQGFRVCRNF